MIRTQIQLTDDQVKALRAMAHQQGISLSETIRRAVDDVISRTTESDKWETAASVIGKYHDTGEPVATDHDRYLAELYGS